VEQQVAKVKVVVNGKRSCTKFDNFVVMSNLKL